VRFQALLLLLCAACDGPSHTLHIELAGDGIAYVRSDPEGLACRAPCEAQFSEGSRVAISAAPGFRSRFVAWEGGGCGEDPTCAIDVLGDVSLTVRTAFDAPVRLSETDRDPGLILSADGLAVDFFESGGARSTHAIEPGSGVFYFETHRLVRASGFFGAGVASDRAELLWTQVGATDQSFGVTGDGSMYYAGAQVARSDGERNERYGFVVDYRGSAPEVHVLGADESGVRVLHRQVLGAIGGPLYIYVVGQKTAPTFQLEINPGNDTENTPFEIDARSILDPDLAGAIVLGWGGTAAGEPDAPPEIAAFDDREIDAGTEVMLEASARDPEEGDLEIEWELLSSPFYAGRVRAEGPRFTFAPTAIGLHPVRAFVRDDYGRLAERIARIRVRGEVAMRERVMLEPDPRSGAGITISPDGLRARWGDEHKMGVRANQALYGEFWYFEIERIVGPVNQGGGIVIGDGNLNPYSWADLPPSMSVNVSDGVYRDLLWHSNLPEEPSSYTRFGFAVDYRGEHPIVYVIGNDEVIDELLLDDVWVEVYPMIYGNETGLAGDGYDMAIHFGEDGFAYDPRAALERYGADASALAVGWGRANVR
jgi:hypothetical protein